MKIILILICLKNSLRLLAIYGLSIFCLSFSIQLRAQDSTGLYNKAFNLPDKFFNSVNAKSNKLQDKLAKSTTSYLDKLSRQEKKMQRKLARKDSAAAKEIFGDVSRRYDGLRAALSDSNVLSSKKIDKFYSGHLDSMKTALNFLQENKVLSQSPALQQKVQSLFKVYGGVEGKLNQTSFIEKQLKERQQYLKERLQKFGNLKAFKKYQEQVYYYRAQMDEYKKTLSDPKLMEVKLLQVAKKFPAFSKFFNKYSELGSIFRLPGSDAVALADIPGLQTRTLLTQEMQQRFGTGPDLQQFMSQSMTGAQSNLDKLKNKINELGTSGSGTDESMPDFKPNGQKTKSLFKRLEWGTNVQSAKSSSLFPVTTDLGLSIGYKVNPKSIVGIGASYKMGWGKDFKHIRISHEGIGLRTFTDIKIKGNFWMTGGGELNYQAPFKDLEILHDLSPWKKSLLAGVSKKYKVSKKIKGNAKLMYDFLYNQYVPVTQPLVFRMGYNL